MFFLCVDPHFKDAIWDLNWQKDPPKDIQPSKVKSECNYTFILLWIGYLDRAEEAVRGR